MCVVWGVVCSVCLVGRRKWLVKVHCLSLRFNMVFNLEFCNVKYACVGAILDFG